MGGRGAVEDLAYPLPLDAQARRATSLDSLQHAGHHKRLRHSVGHSSSFFPFFFFFFEFIYLYLFRHLTGVPPGEEPDPLRVPASNVKTCSIRTCSSASASASASVQRSVSAPVPGDVILDRQVLMNLVGCHGLGLKFETEQLGESSFIVAYKNENTRFRQGWGSKVKVAKWRAAQHAIEYLGLWPWYQSKCEERQLKNCARLFVLY